jgi:serine protease
VSGNLASGADADFFVVQVPAGKSLSATLTMGASTADYDLYVYDSYGTVLARSTNSAGSIDAVTSVNTKTVTAARYVQVRYYSGGTGSTYGKYTLKLGW